MAELPDRIEKQVVLKAPRVRVWRALTETAEFGAWFGVKLEGPFRPGARVQGVSAQTTVDPAVATLQAPYAGRPWEITVEKMEPERLFSFRWHPFAVDPNVDYTAEPSTLVEFVLDDAPGGTRLTIVESGFDTITLARRAQAFSANEGGWTLIVGVLEKYVAQTR